MTINYDKGEPRAQVLSACVEDSLRDKGRASFSMTDATEAIWGTSGRGNPNAVRLIEACAALGYLHIERNGRSRTVSRTGKAIDAGAYNYAGVTPPD